LAGGHEYWAERTAFFWIASELSRKRRPRELVRVETREAASVVADGSFASSSPRVHPTPRISCEAVPAAVVTFGGMRRHLDGSRECRPCDGAAESFVSFIALFDGFLNQGKDARFFDRNVEQNAPTAYPIKPACVPTSPKNDSSPDSA
jgi:hypothetical protein